MASYYSSSIMAESAIQTTNQGDLMEELVHGRDLATQLRGLLWKTDDNGGTATTGSAEELVSKIMASFTNTLFMLEKNDTTTSNNTTNNDGENDSRFLVDSHNSDGPKSEGSEESCKSVSTVAKKDRRGCYKRRKTSNSWKRETPTLIDDGYGWRKYGQKAILKSQYPRNYFRCTHKYDQNCGATKQVQRIQEEPPMYRTTYLGNHTCRNLLNAPELVLDCGSFSTQENPNNNNNNSMLLSFNLASKQSLDHSFFSSSITTSNNRPVKQEFKDEIVASTMFPYCNNNDEDDDGNKNYANAPDRVIVVPDIERFDNHRISSNLWDMKSFEDDVLQHMDFN